jgi:hypothetical protein
MPAARAPEGLDGVQHCAVPRRVTGVPDADPEGFAPFYAAQFSRIATQVYAYLGDHAEAQDITQEAFLRALSRWKSVRYDDRSPGCAGAWNLATSRLRRVQVAVRHLARQREGMWQARHPIVALFVPRQRSHRATGSRWCTISATCPLRRSPSSRAWRTARSDPG